MIKSNDGLTTAITGTTEVKVLRNNVFYLYEFDYIPNHEYVISKFFGNDRLIVVECEHENISRVYVVAAYLFSIDSDIKLINKIEMRYLLDMPDNESCIEEPIILPPELEELLVRYIR